MLPLRARAVVFRVTLHTHLADIPKLLFPKTSIAQRYLGLYPGFFVHPAQGGSHGCLTKLMWHKQRTQWGHRLTHPHQGMTCWEAKHPHGLRSVCGRCHRSVGSELLNPISRDKLFGVSISRVLKFLFKRG